MPKKGGKGKGKKKGKKKKKSGPVVDAAKAMKDILGEYEIKCEETGTAHSVSIKKALMMNIENVKLMTKFIFDPRDRIEVQHWEDENLEQYFGPAAAGDNPAEVVKTPDKPKGGKRGGGGGAKKDKDQLRWIRIERKLHEANQGKRLMRLAPFIEAVRSKRYIYIDGFYVWEMAVTHEDIMSLGGMLSRGNYPIKKLELMDCFIQAHSISTFAPSINFSRTLVDLTLDYNEFGDEGCQGLCNGLKVNKFLLRLSLCYCELTRASGAMLGELISRTPIRELYLDGNELEADGCIALISRLADFSEVEARLREEEAIRKKEEKEMKLQEKERAKSALSGASSGGEASDKEGGKKKKGKKGKKKGKKGKKGKKKGKKSAGPPKADPVLTKLHLADNGIDSYGRGGNFAPIRCMQLFQIILANSQDLAEIDLWGNSISDLGARQILEGLKERKESKLPGVSIRLSHRTHSETFAAITKLSGTVKKKKKAGKKKKKKK